MGQKAKNAGKKKTKIQEPKLATEGIGVLKNVSYNGARVLSKGNKSRLKEVNYLLTQSIDMDIDLDFL